MKETKETKQVEVKNENGKFNVVESGLVIKTYSCLGDAMNFCNKNSYDVTTSGVLGTLNPSMTINIPQNGFSITKRFRFLNQLIGLIISDINPSLIISGRGGSGKSYSVLSQIASAGMKEEEDFIIVKGYSTPKGLFRTLFENKDKLVIFDDCDSVLKDKTSINLLKAALDSYSKRIISWNAEMPADSDLPKIFEFSGRIIFISNLAYSEIDQAVKSRSLNIDLHMTTDDNIQRMQEILVDIVPEASMEVKQDALDFITKHKDQCTDLNMRTLIKIIKIRNSIDAWEELAEYMLTH